MGEPTKEDKQHKQDQADFGSVENVSDLEPHDTGGKHIQAQQQERIMPASANGYFEIEGGAREGLGAPLHLGTPIKHDAGPVLEQYESAYNAYAQPLRSTLRSMGRVKDVALTGAPMTPAELMKRPELAARFSKLKPESNDQAQGSYNEWSQAQTKLSSDVKKFGAGQHQLNAAVAGYRKVQQLLEQRRTEAKKAAKEKELHEIEESAEILAKIVETSFEAWGAIGEIEEGIERKTAFNENAEGDDPRDVEKQPAGNKDPTPNYAGGGKDDDPYGEKNAQKPSAIRQATGNFIEEASYAGKGVAGVVSIAKSKLPEGGSLSLSVRNVFVALQGNAKKYTTLETQIGDLTTKLRKLELAQESSMIEAATEQLKGTKLEFVGQRHDIQTGRVNARKFAKQFGKQMGGDKGTMAMYAAEAYAELAAFGELAAQQRKDMVDPLWGPVHRYLVDTNTKHLSVVDEQEDKHRIAREKRSGEKEKPANGVSAMADAKDLAMNVQAVGEQRTYFAQHLPEWKRNNQQWSEFLKQHTGEPLEVQATEADRRSAAP